LKIQKIMNIKISIISAFAAVALVSASSAAGSLIAGWDFTNPGLDSTATSVQATFSDYGSSDTEFGSGSFGTFSYSAGAPTYAVSTAYNMSTNNIITFADNRSIDVNFGSGQGVLFQNILGAANSSVFTITAATGSTNGFTDFSLTMAAGAQFGGGSIGMEYSLDGVSFVSLSTESVTSAINTGGQLLSFNTGTVNASNEITFRGTLSGIGAGPNGIGLDNIQIGGAGAAVVPEPSTFALFAGLGVASLIVLRRKRA
jgi:hypothetical protein